MHLCLSLKWELFTDYALLLLGFTLPSDGNINQMGIIILVVLKDPKLP